ncbi:tail sheath stabilizer and completion protein [Aeromonas phage 44RR2.8t]|uniref:Tail sheath stabilizer and completion protein n=2 Tax=Biquartavirus 44RR2 TaxID=115987 RepID=Q6U9F1_9CAUD|nr:tail sheath stabilizer [Aeromonas phage 44RR2.8t]AAQ81470.1 tail sheath stabilizer and completion protein [Aeromonas phage 44RR2.8t]APU00623.1 proximal tail sheath stabilization protein [Aeromonas phage 44RR2.8t.2]
MFGNHFYNNSIRRYIMLLMELFGHIQVARQRDGKPYFQDVPITYASKEKFIMALGDVTMPTSEAQIAKVESILPRMNLHLIDAQYNAQVKTGAAQKRWVNKSDGKGLAQFNPVPYTFMFELGIHTRHEDDLFQIIEQILPYFQPHFPCTITELYDNEIIIKGRDINIVIVSNTPDEQIEGPGEQRRRLEWSMMLSFTGWLYPNTKNIAGEIRTIYIDFFGNEREINKETHFESVDHQVVPKNVPKQEWTGESIEVWSDNTSQGEPPRPSSGE